MGPMHRVRLKARRRWAYNDDPLGSRDPRPALLYNYPLSPKHTPMSLEMTKPLEAYTEKAFSLLGGILPEIVFLPPSLRTRPQGASTDDEDQLDRIVRADPLGFLFAIMEGKSVTSFTVKPAVEDQPDVKRKRGRPRKETATARIKIGEEKDCAVYAEFHSPTVADRERVAMFLAKFITRNSDHSEKQSDDDEFALLCEKRAAQAAAEQDRTSALSPTADIGRRRR